MGLRQLRNTLVREGCRTGRRHVGTLMKRMGDRSDLSQLLRQHEAFWASGLSISVTQLGYSLRQKGLGTRLSTSRATPTVDLFLTVHSKLTTLWCQKWTRRSIPGTLSIRMRYTLPYQQVSAWSGSAILTAFLRIDHIRAYRFRLSIYAILSDCHSTALNTKYRFPSGQIGVNIPHFLHKVNALHYRLCAPYSATNRPWRQKIEGLHFELYPTFAARVGPVLYRIPTN